jgi:hypothetical protein
MLERISTHIDRRRDNGVGQQTSISTETEATTEQAIDAAADGDISTSTATSVGSVAAQVEAELATGRNAANQQAGVSGRRLAARR